MTAQIEEFLINMLNMGLSRGEANANAYNYAIALLLEKEAVGGQVSAAMMDKAIGLVREAWTNKTLAYYLQEMKHAMRASR